MNSTCFKKTAPVSYDTPIVLPTYSQCKLPFFLHRDSYRTITWLSWAFLLNIMVAQLLGLRYLGNPTSLPQTAVAWVYALTNWIGQFALLGLILYAVTLPIILIVRNCLAQRLIVTCIAASAQFMILLDTFVFDQYRFHINLLVFQMFLKGHGQIIAIDAPTLVTIGIAACGLWLILYFMLGLLQNFQFRINMLSHHPRKLILAFFLGSYGISQGIYAVSDFYGYRPVSRLGHVFPLNEPTKMNKFLASLGLKSAFASSPSNFTNTEPVTGDPGLAYPLLPITYDAAAQPKLNVLWIVVDTLRADMVRPEIMPNAAGLAAQSQNFSRHVSGSNATRHGIASMFYGLPGTYFESFRSSQTSPVLMDQFRRENYEFGIYASAPLTMPEFDQTVFAHVPNLKKLSRGATDNDRDEEIGSDFHAFLDHRDVSKPFFGFLFYDSVHQASSPKGYPQKFQPALTRVDHLKLGHDTNPTPYLNMYKNSANYVDSLVGKVLGDLKARGLDRNTVVIFTADHGEEFDDNHLNYWGHNSNFSDAQIRVPMLIRWPGTAPKVHTQLSSHYDIAPTLMENLLHVTSPSKHYSSGQNLFADRDFPWIILGTSDNYAILRQNDLTAVKFGSLPEVTDRQLKPLDQEPDPSTMHQAFQEMARFYKSH